MGTFEVLSNAASELNEMKQELVESVGMDLSQPYIQPVQPAITPLFKMLSNLFL